MKILSMQKLGLSTMFVLFCYLAPWAQEQRFEFNNDWAPAIFNFADQQRDPCKVFIGVGTSNVSGGLKVEYTVENTPATTYGVQAGDIIVSLDGVPVSTQSELIRERNKHQQGEAFTLAILREGREITIDARFKACNPEEQDKFRQENEKIKIRYAEQMERMAERLASLQTEGKKRPILGVYENDDVNADGMVIRDVVRGKGAEAAGLQSGDVVTAVDGKKVTGALSLRSALAGHQPGDEVTVVYQRDGKSLQTTVALSTDRNFYVYTTERDPCAVFIGVYTSDGGFEGRGVTVTGIVDETPAKQSGVQPGDVILYLDGQPVNSSEALRYERDKHSPGDPFQLTVMRDGERITIDATFKTCLTPGAPETVKEVVEVQQRDVPQGQKPLNTDNTLPLESLEAYPSPTVGPLTVTFEAEAVPTTVRLTDISGRTVYSKVMNQFNGYFSEQLNLSGNKSGTYILSVQQGNKVHSKQVVLLPRA